LEYWVLLREPPPGLVTTARDEALIGMLREGPQPVPDIIKNLKVLHIGQVEAGELLRQEIVGKAGLTPTDLMHIQGMYTRWDGEAASAALESFAHNRWQEPDEVRGLIWRRITEMAFHAIVTFLSGKRLAAPGSPDVERGPDMATWFFYNSLYHSHPHLDTMFRLRWPIIGIGAPAGLFLKPVAEAFHTDLILPEHFPVANALGAVAGTVMVTEEILVYPRLDHAGLEVLGYYNQTGEERYEFEELGPALAAARALPGAPLAAPRSGGQPSGSSRGVHRRVGHLPCACQGDGKTAPGPLTRSLESRGTAGPRLPVLEVAKWRCNSQAAAGPAPRRSAQTTRSGSRSRRWSSLQARPTTSSDRQPVWALHWLRSRARLSCSNTSTWFGSRPDMARTSPG
jgi:hypothetical protein